MGTKDLCLHLPPWQQKIFSSTMAATGKQLKQSVKVFHSLMLYRRLPDEIGKKQRIINKKYEMCKWKGAISGKVVVRDQILLTLIIEAIYTVDRGALVVATQQEEVFRIFDFVGQQEADGL